MKRVTTILAMVALLAGCAIAKGSEDSEKRRRTPGGIGSGKTKAPEAQKKGPTIKDEGWRIPEDKSKFHVFVLYGQSNMAGGIKERFGGTLTKEEKTPTPHVLQVYHFSGLQ